MHSLTIVKLKGHCAVVDTNFLGLRPPGPTFQNLCLIPKILLAIRADFITNFPNNVSPGSKVSAIGRQAGVSVEHCCGANTIIDIEKSRYW